MIKQCGFLLLLFYSVQLISQSDFRIEPPSWWTGMKNNKFQLMVYGDKVGTMLPTVEGKEVYLDHYSKVENENYLFLNLEIDQFAQAQDINIVFTDQSGKSHTQLYSLHQRQNNSESRQGFDASDIIYLITPDRFCNGDKSNDNNNEYHDKLDREDPYGRHGGDLAGIISKLDYIKEMGYSAIWLNPVLENNQFEQSYHGYATTDY